ncbi:MAG: response regulator [Acidobacteriota bacterium]|nr:MAG: response regulator [Acidobacteriota bacterium]
MDENSEPIEVNQPSEGEMVHGRTKVLIADGSRTIREVVQRALSARGLHVVLARDGLEALELARFEPFELVLLDQSISGLSAFDVVQALRQQPMSRAVPVLLLTDRFERTEEPRLTRPAISDTMDKPFDEKTLVSHVEQWLAQGLPVADGTVDPGDVFEPFEGITSREMARPDEQPPGAGAGPASATDELSEVLPRVPLPWDDEFPSLAPPDEPSPVTEFVQRRVEAIAPPMVHRLARHIVPQLVERELAVRLGSTRKPGREPGPSREGTR